MRTDRAGRRWWGRAPLDARADHIRWRGRADPSSGVRHERTTCRVRPMLHRSTRPHCPTRCPTQPRSRGRTHLRRPRPDRHQPRAPRTPRSSRCVRAGDTLVVTKLDRLARSLPDAAAIADELTTREISLSLGGSVYDPTDAVGRLLFNVLAMVAEFESDSIRLRTVAGMKVAKAKGRLKGNQPKLSRKQEAHLVSLVQSGEYSTLEVAELFGVGRSTVYRAIQRQRSAAKAELADASRRRWPRLLSASRNRHPRGTPTSEAHSQPGSERGIPPVVPPTEPFMAGRWSVGMRQACAFCVRSGKRGGREPRCFAEMTRALRFGPHICLDGVFAELGRRRSSYQPRQDGSEADGSGCETRDGTRIGTPVSSARTPPAGGWWSQRFGAVPPMKGEGHGKDVCSRSQLNYSEDIARNIRPASYTDVTCSGAQTSDFFTSQDAGVAPQLDAAKKDTRLVTMTIGATTRTCSLTPSSAARRSVPAIQPATCASRSTAPRSPT